MEDSIEAPVVIIGAGLAGLRCAAALQQRGCEALVLEASDRVGGRVTSDEIDGFVVDRGFQVFLTSYPENEVLDLSCLDLGEFVAGALCWDGTRLRSVADPRRHPWKSIGSLARSPLSMRDILAVLRLLYGKTTSGASTTRQLLAEVGVSHRALESFFRPFFAGVFLDRELEVPAVFFRFVFEMFAKGRATLPAGGMRRLPEQLAAALPNTSIRLGQRVESLRPKRIVLQGGETMDASAIVIATDFTEAARLLGRTPPSHWRSTTTLWFAADEEPFCGRTLTLDGTGRGPVNNLCCPSSVARGYAPDGMHLLCASIVGDTSRQQDEELVAAAVSQLNSWSGGQAASWRLLAVQRIPQALPTTFGRAGGIDWPLTNEPGLFVCGDYTETPSINGALASGRIAAEQIGAVRAASVAAAATEVLQDAARPNGRGSKP